jgi:hypothetical protein
MVLLSMNTAPNTVHSPAMPRNASFVPSVLASYVDSSHDASCRRALSLCPHEDQLSRSCQFALYRASRNLDRALDRVERIADACWTDIESQCGNADCIGPCVMEKAPSFSPACQTVVTAVR